QRVPLDDLVDHYERQNVDVLALHDALEELATAHERSSQVLTLRFFGGFNMAEVAEQLEVSVTTAERELRFARAWLYRHLGESACAPTTATGGSSSSPPPWNCPPGSGRRTSTGSAPGTRPCGPRSPNCWSVTSGSNACASSCRRGRRRPAGRATRRPHRP